MERVAYLNKCIFAGRMHSIKKIETKTGKTMCTFSVRVYEKQGERENVTFFHCSAYSKIAETILAYGYDKRPVFIEAQYDTYKGSDGIEKHSFKVHEIKLFGDKAE